jgi:hypothetical protein
MEPEDSLLCSQEPATGPYSVQESSHPKHAPQFPKNTM